MTQWDYIIVGGGSAGCVLANRLSARSTNKVLLLEAGSDMPSGKIPADILDNYAQSAYLNPAYRWTQLQARFGRVRHNQPSASRAKPGAYYQARVMGGGSAINGQFANRGAPTDYDEWEERGAKGWRWDAVLPYFRKIEKDLDFDGPFHGQEGRVPVRRIFPDLWDGYAKACGKAFESAGYSYLPDQNGEYVDGYFAPAISNAYDRRVSAAMAYLDPTTRQRPNLTIQAECEVKGLVLDGQHCRGVRASVAGQAMTFTGHEVIVSAGALHSPVLLMQAGIGPANSLRTLGIQPVLDLAGVGQGLMEHPAIGIAAFVKPAARANSFSRRHMQIALRYSSGLDDAPHGDMAVFGVSKSSWHDVGKQIATSLIMVYKTYSQSGMVTLASAEAGAEPVVEFDLLSDARDMERLKDGFRRMAALHTGTVLQDVSSNPFPASYHKHAHQFGAMTVRNRLTMKAAALTIDRSRAFRDFVLNRHVGGEYTLAGLLQSDEALEAFIHETVTGAWHPSCSCKMGANTDRMAVTDEAGGVHGIEGLRVVDASIFPVVPSANTNFPVYMCAEKIAADLLA